MLRKNLCALVLGLLVPASLSMADVVWTGAGSDRLWSNTANWDVARVPNATDYWSDITPNAGGPLIDSTVTAVFGTQMDLGYLNTGSTTYLDMTGGTLTGGKLGVGTYYYSGSSSVMNLSGGDVSLSTSMLVGSRTSGVLNMTGGTVTAAGGLQISVGIGDNPQSLASAGYVHLDGGTFTASYLLMCASGASAGSGHLDITEGKLILASTELTHINTYISNGWITGYGDSSKVAVTTVGDYIEITAVPEPATLGLLVIGGIAGFLRKKRS